MNKMRLAIMLSILVLGGAGCFGLGGAKVPPDGGVFRSTNSGNLWQQKVAVPGPKGVGSMGTQNILTLALDPQDHEVLYAGTRASGLLFSLDAGESWQQPKLAALKSGAISAIAVDPKDLCVAYLAKGPRLYKTSSCLRLVNEEAYVETRASVAINEVAVDWFNNKVVWLGLSNGDVLKSVDGGTNWRTMLNAKKEVTALIVNNGDSRNVMVGTAGGGFFKTEDSGDTWKQIDKELKNYRSGNYVLDLVQTKDSQVAVASTKYGLLITRDFGDSWGDIKLLTAPGQVTIKALAVNPNDGNQIYYAALQTFYITRDGGATWNTNKLPTARLPQTLLVDPVVPSVLYVGVAEPEKK
jgi:photosystem II stability/assembly factor-like uncharacterized protein